MIRHYSVAVLLSSIFIVGCSELVFVQVISRHGDKAPGGVAFPKDPYGLNNWPRGWHELTNLGVWETHQLGQFYRKRYVIDSGFLSADYKYNEIYVRSSDEDRSLTSAQSILYGLFPATGTYIWDTNKGNSWQPIAVHSFLPSENDLLLKPTSVDCPAYDALVKKREEQLAKEYNTKYEKFFSYIKNVTGLTVMNMSTISDVYGAVNPEDNGPQLVYDVLVELKRVNRLSEFDQPQMGKFVGGFLLHDMVNRMQQKANGSLKSPDKMVIYSSHDGTVTGLMYALGIGNGLLTPYAASVMLELHKNDNGQFEVKTFYKNSTNSALVFEMYVPGCPRGAACPLNTFVAAVKPQTFAMREEYDAECGVLTKNEKKKRRTKDITKGAMQVARISSAVTGLIVIGPMFIQLAKQLY